MRLNRTIKRLNSIISSTLTYVDRYSPYPKRYEFKMSENEKVFFDNAVKHCRNYLEFGSGGSTLRAIQKSKARIYTVESSPEWLAHMRKYLILRLPEQKRVFIFPVDIGPTEKWGRPASEKSEHLFESYSSAIFNEIDTQEIDLVLIDGRFRVACTLKTILECQNNNELRILIHDFWNRGQYHVLLKYLDTIDRVDTIGLFSIKKKIDLQSVKTDYESYKNNPG